MTRRPHLLAVLATLAALAVPLEAHAGAPAECTDSYVKAQQLRKDGKFVEARSQLRVCTRASCPGLIVSDCAQWLDEVGALLPSIVPLATDDAGANLVDVKLSVDGAPVTVPPGQAIDLDPGPHHLVFERAGFVTAEKDVLVAVGERNKRFVVTLHAVGRGAASPSHGGLTAVATAGVVVAGVGVAGLIIGGVFGGLAVSQQSSAHCPGNVCPSTRDASELTTAKSSGNVSTIAFVAGGALVVGGAAMWFFGRDSHGASTGWLSASPMTLANGGGLLLRGAF